VPCCAVLCSSVLCCADNLCLQRWYARDAASAVQQQQQQGAGTVFTGYVATLDVDVPAALTAAAAAGGGSSSSSSHTLQLWSAEEPHLYLLVVKLVDGGGQVVEVEGCQVCVFKNVGQVGEVLKQG